MTNKSILSDGPALMYLGWIGTMSIFGVTALVGWVLNIVKLVEVFDADLTTEIVLRIVGIPVAPMGAIMGLFV